MQIIGNISQLPASKLQKILDFFSQSKLGLLDKTASNLNSRGRLALLTCAVLALILPDGPDLRPGEGAGGAEVAFSARRLQSPGVVSEPGE